MTAATIPTNDIDAIEAERTREIDKLRAVLTDALNDVQTRLREAEHAISQLASNYIYDIEYAESTTSGDLQHMVADASRAVRIALMLKQQIES